MRPLPLALLALTLSASAQDLAKGPGIVSPAFPELRPVPAPWGPPRGLPGTSFATHALPRYLGLTPTDGELVAAMLRPDVPPVRREDLEGPGERTVPYHDLPGGIVLGLEAGLPDELAGARLEVDAAGRPTLVTPGAGRFELPPLDPELLVACLDFARSPGGSHTAVSMIGDVVRLAPELAGGRIGRLLERADGAPHAHLPAARGTKTMIVDRDVRIEVATGRATPRADLELRFYTPADSMLARGRTRRLGTLVLADGPGGLRATGANGAPGPNGADVRALAKELDVVAELAGWIGLFRRVAREDPAGLAAFRSRLAR